MKIKIGNIFYEQITGSTFGQMSMIPNNPVLWTLFESITDTTSNVNAISKVEFIKFLNVVIQDLEDDLK